MSDVVALHWASHCPGPCAGHGKSPVAALWPHWQLSEPPHLTLQFSSRDWERGHAEPSSHGDLWKTSGAIGLGMSSPLSLLIPGKGLHTAWPVVTEILAGKAAHPGPDLTVTLQQERSLFADVIFTLGLALAQ